MSKLYIVPTPVGNLEDMTFRAVKVLKQCSLILCEDTRTSSGLLKHFEINVPVASHHKFNEHETADYYASRVLAGEDIALISDAGTPAISDPGFMLVRACVQKGVQVECLPGATAFVPALVDSGFGCESFIFNGFLPQKKGRQKRLKFLSELDLTVIFYESPYRVTKLLQEIGEYFGKDRKISVTREISKIYEETLRGTSDELLEAFKEKAPKGEFVVVVDKKGKNSETED
ncbi:MAG: 16S rRNA (cytidine(1402)-2'-O)-methyltransferase [Bacteroidales bacterium]|jgi:16S rRNA (cytidine1402-2'-O)-methyltransferase|nr:16S rRNA (cytidine(1402)-2'-O)-methyltransferase [Bacteroidales bacterium]MBR6277332.1 16S rRNA (cytidine(1402)-2'-O)-methyltransferase [Bacteroidales bacterium]